MKKTQMALAAVALVASSAALAMDVTVSGVVDFGYQSLSNSGAGTYDAAGTTFTATGTAGGTQQQLTTGNLSPNFLTVSANEDLGGGLKANVTFQNLIDRSAFNPLGVKATVSSDSMGELTVGNWLDPLFLALAPHSAKTDGGSNIGGFVTPYFASNISGIWVQNQVAYTTPDFGGLKATAFIRTGEVPGNSATGGASGFTASYSAGPFGFAAGTSDRRDATNNAIKATVAGGSYDMGAVKVGVIYMSSKDGSVSNMKKDSYGVNFSVPVDALTVSLGHYQTEVSTTTNKGQVTVLTGLYALSKRTSLFANVEAVQNTGAAVYTPNAGYTNCGTNVGGCDTATAGYYDMGRTGSSTGVTAGIRHSF